jgi:hypothetical protein
VSLATSVSEGIYGEVAEAGDSLGYGVERQTFRTYGEALARQDSLNESAVPQYPLITFDPFDAGTAFYLRPGAIASKQPSAGEVRSLSPGNTTFHEGEVTLPCGVWGRREVGKHIADILPWMGLADEAGMTGVRVAGKSGEFFDQSCS